jgi:hypothetical protein
MDERRQRQHRGRGPSSYRRSDDRIRDDINDRLTDDPFLDATEIIVVVESGEVTLNGTVDSRNDKRRAEDLAENVSGVSNVQNNLRLSQGSSGIGTTTGSSTGATGTSGTAGTAAAAGAGASSGTTGTTGTAGTTGSRGGSSGATGSRS